MKISSKSQQPKQHHAKQSGLKKTKARALVLEPRYMFDGAAVTSAGEVIVAESTSHTEGTTHDSLVPASTITAEKLGMRSDRLADTSKPELSRREIVFIDTSVANWQQLVDATRVDVEVALLNPDRDALSQIAQKLAESQTSGQLFDSVHIVSHGAEGQLIIGQSSYNIQNLAVRQNDLNLIASAIKTDGDILLYGCDIAHGSDGEAFIQALAAATQADVAASNNTTGASAAWNGDWALEQQNGDIKSLAFATPVALDQFQGKLATINLSGSSGWTTVMKGVSKDPQGDSQAGAADTDIIGDASHGSFYVAFDDKGTVSTADDVMVFRMRIDNPTSATNFAGVAVVGMDANLDGKIDLFISVDGRNNSRAINLLDPGTGLNLSPSTTSTNPLPTGWLPNNGVYPFSAGNYSVNAVSAATDPNWGPSSVNPTTGTNSDISGDGKTDVFVSWSIPIADIATVLAKASPIDRNGIGPRGTTGIAGFSKDTLIQYVNFTQTQNGPINGDLNGVPRTYDKNASFSDLGTLTSPMSPSNPVPDGIYISINEPIGDGNLAAVGTTEASSVTLSGTTKASVGSTVNLIISDNDGGTTNVTATATVVAGSNGVNTWSVSGVNLSSQANGILTVAASVTDGSGTANDTATVSLDKDPPVVTIDQLASSTLGTPTITGTSNLPDGSLISVTLDPDNNPATANISYQLVVSGGAWTLNTATATPISGTMPASGLSADTKITASASDTAGNSTTVTALNRPTVTSQTTGSTLPTIQGKWTSIAGDTLTIKIYDNSATLLASYSLGTPSSDDWSVNLSSTSKDGGGTLAALLADATYNITAEVTRGGTTVADTSSGELVIVSGPTIDITGATNITETVARPTFQGSSSIINGYVKVSIDPDGVGAAGLVVYSVATNGSGAWTLNTSNPSASNATLLSGALPATGLSGTAVVTATTPANANGQVATDTQNVTINVPTIMIGTSASNLTGIETSIASGDSTALIITGDGIFNVLEDNSVVVNGSTTNVAAGTNVVITISDGTTTYTKTTTVQANGSWTLSSASSGTANDGNAFNLSALKNTGLLVTATTMTVSAEKNVSHDALAPQIVLTSPSIIKTSSAAATGNTSLPSGSIINISTNYPQTGLTATVDANGDFSTPLSMNGNGSVTITASSTATDSAGNKVANATQTVSYQNPNTTPPAVSITSITGISGTDNTLSSGDIASGTTVSGTYTGTATTSSGTFVFSITDGVITKTGSDTGVTFTRNVNGTWSAVLTSAVMSGFSNGNLVVKIELTDNVGSGGGTTYTVRDVAQPTLFLVNGTASVSINEPIDSNNLINATEDDNVTISGRSVNATGGTLTLTVSDGDNATTDPTGSATVGSDGTWTVSGLNLSALNDGNLTISATLDPDANPATSNNVTDTATTVHDKTPPQIYVNSAAIVGNNNPVISGTSTGLVVGATITVEVDTDRNGVVDQTYTTTVQSDSSWRVTASNTTPIGSKITVSASDAAGNASSVVTTAISAISTDSGANTTDFITNDQTLTLTGYAEANAVVTIKLDGNTLIGSPVTANASGVWTLDYSTQTISNGSHTLTAQITDASGDTALSTQTITVDHKSVAISSITSDTGDTSSDFKTKDNSLIFNGTATANAPVTVSLTDSSNVQMFQMLTMTSAGGVWTVDHTNTNLADGTYTLRATITDASGVSTTSSQALVIDTKAQIGFTTNYKSSTTTPIISGTTDIEAGRTLDVAIAIIDGATYTYTTTVASDGTWTLNTGNTTPSGHASPVSYANNSELTISASGSDLSGNSASSSKVIIVDTAAPTITITEALDYTGSNTPNGSLSTSEDTNVILRGSTTNATVGGTVRVSITDGITTISDTGTIQGSYANGTWQLASNNLRSLAAGTITVTATYMDDSGTWVSDTATVQHVKGSTVSIDSISQDSALAGDFVTNDSSLIFSGSSSPGDTVSLTLTGTSGNFAGVSVITNASGVWTYDYSGTSLSNGNYTLQASSGTSASQAIVVDTTAPSGPITVTSQTTSDTTPSISGTATIGAGESLSVTVNGITYIAGDGNLTVNGSNWTLNIPASQALSPANVGGGFNGIYQVIARLTDAAGNTLVDSSSNELTISDSTKPIIDLAPNDNASVNYSGTSVMGAATSLDSNITPATLVESSDKLSFVKLTVSGLVIADGNNEKLIFGSTTVNANGSSGTQTNITVGGVQVTLNYSDSSFNIQKSNFGSLSAAEAQSIIRDIQYQNNLGASSTAGNRIFSFVAIDDADNVADVATSTISVNLGSAPSQTTNITQMSKDSGDVNNDFITNDGSANRTVSGTISASLNSNEIVEVSFDGGSTWQAATTTGTSWSINDSGSYNANWTIQSRVSNTLTSLSGSVDSQSVTLDTTAPTITISTDDSSLTVGETATLTFTLSESASNFDLSDITVSGGTLSNFSGSGTSYTATFTPTPNSTTSATVSVAAGRFTDVANNQNLVSNSLNMSVNTVPPDTTPPTITISTDDSSLTVGETATLTFTLSESASNFDLSDITVSGGTLSNFSGSGTSYTATFTPTPNSTTSATVSVAAGRFTDAANNQNLVSNSLNMSVNTVPPDTTPPTITISTDDSSLTVGETATLTFTLSESASNFDLSDITVSGGTLSNFSGSGTSYTATFTPTPNSTTSATVSVAAGRFTDAANNQNLVSNSLNMSVNTVPPDTTPPTITISTDDSSLTVGETATLTFTLSESASNFDLSDITVSGGTLSNFSGSGTSYTATFTPTPNSTTSATVSVAAGRFTDVANNQNLVSNSLNMSVNTVPPDTTPPTITISTDDSSLTVGETATLTFTLSESASNFDLSDITVSGGTLSNFSGSGTSYTATFTPTPNSTTSATVSVAAGRFTDAANNQNLVSNSLNMSVNTVPPDTTPPTITISTDDSSLTVGETATLTFTLSESASNFDLSDITVSGGTLSNFSGSGTSYTATFTPTPNSTTSATVSVAAGRFTDAANNQNLVSNSLNMSVNTVPPDTTPPTITISTDDSSLTVGETATLTFTLSESASNFDLSDITVSGGTLSNFSGSGTSYTATFTPTPNSTTSATVSVAAGRFTDAANNQNLVSNSLNMSVNTVPPDTTPPTITISTDDSSLTVGETATLTFTLSESASNFDLSDITVSGGTLSNFSGSGTSYTATFTPTPNSTTSATVSVAAGRFTDAANNQNLVSNSLNMSVNTVPPDTTPPTITISTNDTNLTVGETATLTFTLSESASNFDLSDITVSGGTLSNFSGSGTSYTATFTPTPNSTTSATVSVAAGRFTDAANNQNLVSNSLNMSVNTVPSDTTPPTITISTNDTNLTVGETATLTFTLSESASNFDLSDITVNGGTLSNFSGSGTSYTATFTPTPNSTTSATVSVAAGRFTDAANNQNLVSNSLNMSVNTVPPDTTPPTITISTNDTNLTVGETATLTFTLSESASNFDLSDITVSGGTLSNFSGSGTSYTATFTPTPNSTTSATVSVAAGRFTDAANNQNLVSNSLNMSVNTVPSDTTPPTITISTNDTNLTVGETATLTFTLSESASNFDLSDITVNGGTLSNFSGSGTSYTATFTPTPNSTTSATVSVAAGRFTDAANNQNLVSNSLNMSVNTVPPDTTPPTITISTNDTNLTVGETATLTFTLSESASNFDLSDITVSGGTLSNFSGSGTSYTATFTPTPNSTTSATVSVAAGRFTDAANNQNLVSNSLNMSVNTVPPDTTPATITISTNDTNLTVGETATLTFTLSESASNFDLSDITVSGGTLSNFSGSGTSYTATFTPTPNSTTSATVSVAAGRFTDAANNQNLVSNSLNMSVNTTSIVPPKTNPTPDPIANQSDTTTTSPSFPEVTISDSSNSPTSSFSTVTDVVANSEANPSNALSSIIPLSSNSLGQSYSNANDNNANNQTSYINTNDSITQNSARVLEFSNVVTSHGQEAFQIAVVKASDQGLMRFRGVPDQILTSSGSISVQIPVDAFVHTDEKAVVRLSVRMANGDELPQWLEFNATTGKFTGTPPPDMLEEVVIIVEARDADGRKAETTFKIKPTTKRSDGRTSLSQQFMLTARHQDNFNRSLNEHKTLKKFA